MSYRYKYGNVSMMYTIHNDVQGATCTCTCTAHTIVTMPGKDVRAILILICPLRGVSLGTRGARGHAYLHTLFILCACVFPCLQHYEISNQIASAL